MYSGSVYAKGLRRDRQGSNLCLCGVAEVRSVDVTYGLAVFARCATPAMEIRCHLSYIRLCGYSVTKK